MKQKAPLQQMLDEQGYLIIATRRSLEVGEVLGGFIAPGCAPENISASVVVADHATWEEFKAQQEKYLRKAPRVSYIDRSWFFVKVVAE